MRGYRKTLKPVFDLAYEAGQSQIINGTARRGWNRALRRLVPSDDYAPQLFWQPLASRNQWISAHRECPRSDGLRAIRHDWRRRLPEALRSDPGPPRCRWRTIVPTARTPISQVVGSYSILPSWPFSTNGVCRFGLRRAPSSVACLVRASRSSAAMACSRWILDRRRSAITLGMFCGQRHRGPKTT